MKYVLLSHFTDEEMAQGHTATAGGHFFLRRK